MESNLFPGNFIPKKIGKSSQGEKMIEYYNHPTYNDKWIVDLYKGKTEGYFFEAGALNGISGSCTYTLEKHFNWKGLLVEPGKHFRQLQKNRPNSICENLCVSDKNGEVVFIDSPDSGFSGIKDKLIRMEKRHLEKYGKPKDQWRAKGYKERRIESITFYDLLKKHGAPGIIHYAAFDMEGSEYDALKNFPFDRYKILAISVEGDSCNELLKSKGYTQVKNKFNTEAPWERYFIHKDFSDLCQVGGGGSSVFIVGMPRSGTSIMYRTIQKLPNFHSGEKINLWETWIFADSTAFNTEDLYYPGLLGYLYNDRAIYDEFLNAVKPCTDKLRQRKTPEKHPVEIKPPEGLFKKLRISFKNKLVELRWKRSCKRKIIREYFACAKKHRKTKRMVEKTPHHFRNVHRILWTFPDSRIIWMIRHPLDVITSSIMRAKHDEKYTHHWSTGSFIEMYRNSFLYYNFYKTRFHNRIILVKYEDFVDDPANETKKICRFIDEPFDEDCLILKEHETPKKRVHSTFKFPEITKLTHRNWKEHIPMEEARKIETALQDIMKKYGYDFYT